MIRTPAITETTRIQLVVFYHAEEDVWSLLARTLRSFALLSSGSWPRTAQRPPHARAWRWGASRQTRRRRAPTRCRLAAAAARRRRLWRRLRRSWSSTRNTFGMS
jgi:hypothetical protein